MDWSGCPILISHTLRKKWAFPRYQRSRGTMYTEGAAHLMRTIANSRFISRRQYSLFILTCILLLSLAMCAAQQPDKQPAALPDAPKQSATAPKGFFARWANFYRQDWSPPNPSNAAPSPAPARRGLPSPLDSPPFPNSDWSYGGSPRIVRPGWKNYPRE